jgi:hypothetical protein
MTYIPLNKIRTNLSTNGTEYQTLDGVPYVGFYWKQYTGEVFTGKTPNDLPSLRLVPISRPSSSPSPLTPLTSYSLLNIDDLGESQDNLLNPILVEEYQSIKEINYQDLTYLLPSPYYPTPTEDDYNLGVFTRYFCVKVNEDIYLEIDKDTYNALLQEDETYEYALYIPFRLQWTLTGEEKEVELTNSNAIAITEQRLNRRGLREFLRGNYLKFYKP